MQTTTSIISRPTIPRTKPRVSYWKSGDPCYTIPYWKDKLTEINVINTKRLSDDFIDLCVAEKHRIFLHVNITGMGKTIFEPHIPTVRETFLQLRKLIERGFPQKQILICVNPILPNDNGLRALGLLVRVFTEFKMLRFRNVRFSVMRYKENDEGKFVVGCDAINKRPSTKRVISYLCKSSTFMQDYYKLIGDNASVISVDKGEEALIGVRELMVFGYQNEWTNDDGTKEKIINYEKNNRYKPIVNIISNEKPYRCKNICLLCEWYG